MGPRPCSLTPTHAHPNFLSLCLRVHSLASESTCEVSNPSFSAIKLKARSARAFYFSESCPEFPRPYRLVSLRGP